MPYITHKERQAILFALSVGVSVIIVGLCFGAAIGGLTCPPNVFC